jgi:heat shock protein HtpX
MPTVGLNTYIWNNNLRCLLLLGLYPLLMLGLLWACGAAFGFAYAGSSGGPALPFAERLGDSVVAQYWPLMLTCVALWFVISYFGHAGMMRQLSRATPINRLDDRELYNLLENLCIGRGLKMPRLNIIETDALNAFASGIDDNSYSITVTRGLRQALPKDELTHIINRDVRLMVVSVIFTGMLGFCAQLLWTNLRWGFFFGDGGYGTRRDNRGGRGNIIFMLMAVDLILWLGYLATVFTRFALSRRREYMADAGSVELTHNPEGMIRALQRLQNNDRIPGAPEDVSLMCICNSRKFLGIFATHPPLEDRIAAIARITGTAIPQLQADAEPFHNPWT